MLERLQETTDEGWPQAFRLADYSFSVTCGSDAIADVIGSLFAACRTELATSPADAYEIQPSRGSDGAIVELRVGGKRLARGAADMVIDRLIWETSSRSFTQGDLLFVHAGVVAVDGVGVMLPGGPDQGKSTTVAGLVRAGFDFLSDEAAALDMTVGAIRSFPRPITLSGSSLDALPGLRGELPARYDAFWSDDHRIAPVDLRPDAVGTTCHPAFIVAPAYREGKVTRIEPMGRADTLRLLVDQSFNLTRFGGDGFRFLADVVRRAECYRLTIGDLPTAVRAVQGLFDRVEA